MATKILIIEDSLPTLDTICLAFENGWPEAEIIKTCYGEEGLEISRRSCPDLIILDLGLPDISGFEVLSRFRRFSNAPVLVLSATPYEDSAIETFKSGADEYMTKPFSSSELLNRARILLPIEMAMAKSVEGEESS